MHEGHRERIRERYRKSGLQGFADHEVLELLLFYANKRGDTNATAHRLLEHFGSLSAVLEASPEELRQVDGIGDVAATLLTMVPGLFRRYSEDKAGKITQITDASAATEYIIPRFFGLKEERAALLCLDSQQRINNFVFISEGALSTTEINVRRAVQTALNNNAFSVILCHNHPGGVASPSKADIETTRRLQLSFNAVGIHIDDHIICNDLDSFSMANHERFSYLFIK